MRIDMPDGPWYYLNPTPEELALVARGYRPLIVVGAWCDLASAADERSGAREKAAWVTGSAYHRRESDRSRAWARFCNDQARAVGMMVANGWGYTEPVLCRS